MAMPEMQLTQFWCSECGQPLAICDGEGLCASARKRSVIGLRGIYVSILPFVFIKIDTLPFTIALQEYIETEVRKEGKRLDKQFK
jgi:hypothetical protein